MKEDRAAGSGVRPRRPPDRQPRHQRPGLAPRRAQTGPAGLAARRPRHARRARHDPRPAPPADPSPHTSVTRRSVPRPPPPIPSPMLPVAEVIELLHTDRLADVVRGTDVRAI